MLFILKVWFTSSRVIVILMLFILRKYKLIKPDNYLKLCKTTTAHEPHNSFPHFRQKKKASLACRVCAKESGNAHSIFRIFVLENTFVLVFLFLYWEKLLCWEILLYWETPLYWEIQSVYCNKYFCTGK